jgi:F0F1-type ATP synthase assembly protein I
MIKNLLNADEDPPPGTKVIIEETVVNPPAETPPGESLTGGEETSKNLEARPVFEVPEDAKFFTKPSETAEVKAPLDEDSESISALMAEIENLEPEDLQALETEIEKVEAENSTWPETGIENAAPVAGQAETRIENAPPVETLSAEETAEKTPPKAIDDMPSGTLFQSEAPPQSMGETIRQSGLAYSAAIILLGSVVFMMVLGWLADWLLGSAPWGIVGGIILGGIIGFIQFFRITSQIFKK